MVVAPQPPGPCGAICSLYVAPFFKLVNRTEGEVYLYQEPHFLDEFFLDIRTEYEVAFAVAGHLSTATRRAGNRTRTPVTAVGAATVEPPPGEAGGDGAAGGGVLGSGGAARCDQTPGLPALAIATGSTLTPATFAP